MARSYRRLTTAVKIDGRLKYTLVLNLKYPRYLMQESYCHYTWQAMVAVCNQVLTIDGEISHHHNEGDAMLISKALAMAAPEIARQCAPILAEDEKVREFSV